MSDIFVSVIIPLYNSGEYIEETLKSIIYQSYENIEIIIVNDCSTDNSMFVVEKILKESNRKFCVKSNRKNLGQAYSRNIGIEEANGEWILFMDSDDILQSNAIEEIVNTLHQRRDKIYDFIFFAEENVRVENRDGARSKSVGVIEYDCKSLQKKFLTRKEVVLVHGTLFRKDWLKMNNITFPNVRYVEDLAFAWMAVLSSNYSLKIKAKYYKYLIRDNSVMTSSSVRKIIDIFPFYEKFFENLLVTYDLSSDVRKYIRFRWAISIIHSTAKQLSYEDYLKVYDLCKKMISVKMAINFPDIRVNCLALVLLLPLPIQYRIFKKI